MLHIIGIKYLFLSQKAELELEVLGQEIYWLNTLRRRMRQIRRGQRDGTRSHPQLGTGFSLTSPGRFAAQITLVGPTQRGVVLQPLHYGNSHLAKGKCPEKSASLSCSHNTSTNERSAPVGKGDLDGTPKVPTRAFSGIAQILFLLMPSTPIQAQLFQSSCLSQFLGKLKREEGQLDKLELPLLPLFPML